MTYEAFKDFVVDTLGEKIDVSGATLYSSFLTLRPGRLLIMGLNPGGSESVSIRDSMDLLKADPNYNESKVRMTVIGLPHLSRYHLYVDNPVKKDVLRWMARIGARENS